MADTGSHSQSWLLVWACILCTLVTSSCVVVWLAWRTGQVLSRRVRLAWQRAMSTGAWLRQDVRDQGQELREQGPQRQQAHQGRGPGAQDLHPATQEGADPTASKRPRTERKSQDTPDFNALPLVRPGLHLHAEKNRVGGAESQRHHYLREQECRGPLRTAGASLRWGARANNPRLPVQWRRPCLVVGQRCAEAASQRPFRTPVRGGALYPHGGVRSRDHLSWQAALLLGFPVRRRSVGSRASAKRPGVSERLPTLKATSVPATPAPPRHLVQLSWPATTRPSFLAWILGDGQVGQSAWKLKSAADVSSATWKTTCGWPFARAGHFALSPTRNAAKCKKCWMPGRGKPVG